MAVTYTQNYNLGKQEDHSNKFDMTIITENMEKIDAALFQKINAVTGRGLSANDFTDEEKQKLSSLENYDDAGIRSEIAVNRSTLGYQRKNLIKNNCQSRTVNGVAAAVNSDGSITLNGANTGSAASVFYFCIENGSSSANNSTVKFYPNGRYILSGELDDRAYIQYCYYDESGIHTLARTQKNITVTDAMTANSTRLIITAGAVFNNETIYPMLRCADITDDTYEPYKPSVEERLAALEAAIMGGET